MPYNSRNPDKRAYEYLLDYVKNLAGEKVDKYGADLSDEPATIGEAMLQRAKANRREEEIDKQMLRAQATAQGPEEYYKLGAAWEPERKQTVRDTINLGGAMASAASEGKTSTEYNNTRYDWSGSGEDEEIAKMMQALARIRVAQRKADKTY